MPRWPTTDLRWELGEVRRALATPRFYRTLATMAVGVTVYAISLNGVVIPNMLFAPGVSGLSLIWFYVVGFPTVGITYFLLNIPLFILGWREYTLKFVMLTVIGVAMFAVAVELTTDVRIDVNDPLLAAIVAGVLTGAGSGFYLRYGGSAGGLDILGAYLKKKFAVPFGTLFIFINVFNLAGAMLLSDLNTVLYSAVFMWVNSWTLEKVQTGFSQRNAVLIISDKPDEVAREVIARLDRGVTFFHATGGYLQSETKVIYSVINLFELGKLKDLMFEVDPNAFMVVYNTTEVIGTHFLTWEEQGYLRRPA